MIVWGSKTVTFGLINQPALKLRYSSDIILSLWCLDFFGWLTSPVAFRGLRRGSSADSKAGQQAFREEKNISSLGEDQCGVWWTDWEVLLERFVECVGKLRSAPSWEAPRRTLSPASPKYLAVLHKHWPSPPWSGHGPLGVHTADQSEWQTDASPGGLHPVEERQLKNFLYSGCCGLIVSFEKIY